MSQAARPGTSRRQRLVVRVALVGVALLAVVVGVYAQYQLASRRLVGGDVLAQPYQAPDFSLTDQFDHPRNLRDFRGRPIALTFVYTNCPDVCPLIAAKMHAAEQKLGPDAQRVTLLAVTVDPERDNVPQVRKFSEQRGLLNEWFFLTGTRPQLEQVWKIYGIYAQTVDERGNPVTPVANSQDHGSPEVIEHTAPIFLIDKGGNVRALLPTDFQVDDLVADFRILLGES